MIFRLAMLVALAGMAAAVTPEVAVRLGESPASVPDGVSVTSSTRGSDRLECLREGEWSVGSLEVGAPAGDGPLALRILGGASLAPVPALVRCGERETYVRNAHREGADVVARLPRPAAGGHDHYELVDLSSSVEWKVEPELLPDPRDTDPPGNRRALVLIPADDEPTTRRPRDARFAPFGVLRDAPAYAGLLAGTKPYLFHYPAYRGAIENGAALARLLRALDAPRVALIAHGNGAAILRHALEIPALKRRVDAALTLSPSTPPALLESALGR